MSVTELEAGHTDLDPEDDACIDVGTVEGSGGRDAESDDELVGNTVEGLGRSVTANDGLGETPVTLAEGDELSVIMVSLDDNDGLDEGRLEPLKERDKKTLKEGVPADKLEVLVDEGDTGSETMTMLLVEEGE